MKCEKSGCHEQVMHGVDVDPVDNIYSGYEDEEEYQAYRREEGDS